MKLQRMFALALMLFGASVHASDREPGKEAIQRMLLEGHWTLVYETTQDSAPGSAGVRNAKAFFVRDGKLMGQWANRPPGFECVYEVKLRNDGFSFMRCGGYTDPYTELAYDPRDSKYPFKRISTPSKWWLERRQ